MSKHFNEIHGHAAGKTMTREYISWRSMRGRCLRKYYKDYESYGGRGIKICKRWGRFDNFLEDMGLRPKGMSLERIDNNANYCPENCKWATHKEQSRNKKNNRRLTFKGQTKCVAEWSEELDLSPHLIYHRIARGWTVEKALTTPPIPGNAKRGKSICGEEGCEREHYAKKKCSHHYNKAKWASQRERMGR